MVAANKIIDILAEIARDFLSQFLPLKPDRLFLVITRKCNAKCLICHIWTDEGVRDIDTKQWCNIIRTNKNLLSQVNKVDITGGEPFLREDINHILSTIIKELPSLKKVLISSNGFCTQKIEQKTNELLASLEVKKIELVVTVSLDGLGNVHDKIRGTEGAFDKATATLRCLRNLRDEKKRFHLSVTTVMQSLNIEQLRDIFNYVKSEYAIDDHLFIPASYSENFQKNMDADINYSQEQKAKIKDFLKGRIQDKTTNPYHRLVYSDIIAFFEGREQKRRCPFLRRSLVIDNNAMVMPCFASAADTYGLSLSDLKRLWYSKKRKSCIRDYQKNRCPSCDFICGVGYWAIIKNEIKRCFRRK